LLSDAAFADGWCLDAVQPLAHWAGVLRVWRECGRKLPNRLPNFCIICAVNCLIACLIVCLIFPLQSRFFLYRRYPARSPSDPGAGNVRSQWAPPWRQQAPLQKSQVRLGRQLGRELGSFRHKIRQRIRQTIRRRLTCQRRALPTRWGRPAGGCSAYARVTRACMHTYRLRSGLQCTVEAYMTHLGLG
jgi:hypothetical protein